MQKNKKLSLFEKNLTIWVVVCMVIGVFIGKYIPSIPNFLGNFEYANVSIPIAILIWMMIYPMMIKVDFLSIKNIKNNPRGLYLTWTVNWLIKPFSMYVIAYFFLYVLFSPFIEHSIAKNYLAGAILLGAAPCTAMVFVWSNLTNGHPAYTVVQVATNDLIILFAFSPIVAFLLGVSGVSIPWATLLFSVFLFVLIPLGAGAITREIVIGMKGKEYFNNVFIKKFGKITIIGLLLTLIIIFSYQGEVILKNPLHVFFIAIPLTVQTYFIFFISYISGKKMRLPHNIAAPAAMIGSSNFFELSVAVAISLFGTQSLVVLSTVVGVLVEVPVMLSLVNFSNRTKYWFAGHKEIDEINPKLS